MARTKKHETEGSKEMSDVGPLENWYKLNEFLRRCSEKDALKLLEAEKRGGKRRMFLLRIHSRVNKTRADRERAELTEAFP